MSTIRLLERADAPAWFKMRQALWPECSDADNQRDVALFLGHPERYAVFVSDKDDGLNGFVEVGLRDVAEGCDSSPVGFVEGWYVAPRSRRSGVGRALIQAAERWALSNGCSEMASDTQPENIASQEAHSRLGYAEVERLVCFRKDLRAVE